MADPRELGGLQWERDAELAYSKSEQIEKAAEWCRRNGPHHLEFLNQMRKILIDEEVQMARMGLAEALRTGAVKRSSVLTLLSPSQALRLLECHLRATSGMWGAKNIREMDDMAADRRRDATIADIRRKLRSETDEAG